MGCRGMGKLILLSKYNQTATVETLAPKHLDEILLLQQTIIDALPENQKRFMIERRPNYFSRFLNKIDGQMLGIFLGNRLISQGVVMSDITLGEAKEQNAITKNDIIFHYALDTDTISVIKSVGVHPEFRGNNLAQRILDAAYSLSAVKNSQHIFAQISADNHKSLEIFLRNKFFVISAHNDPTDLRTRYVLQRSKAKIKMVTPAKFKNIDFTNISLVNELTQRQLLIGVQKKNVNTLSFYQPAFSY